MFYDLPSPIDFAKNVYECLADDGIWHLEQSYMPSMIKNTSYDTMSRTFRILFFRNYKIYF